MTTPTTTHKFDSDLEDANLFFNGWAEETLTPEQYEDFLVKFNDKHEVMDYYHMWLKDQKITHTVIQEDGTESVTSYQDIP